MNNGLPSDRVSDIEGRKKCGIRGYGMMSHISQMMVQRLNKMLKGETENFDILGNTAESAIQATKQALYDLDYPGTCV